MGAVTKRRFGGRIVVYIAVSLALMFSVCAEPMAVSAEGEGTNQAVNASRNGVVQIILTYSDTSRDVKDRFVQQGSGFLIGGEAGVDTVITNKHVVTLDDESTRYYKKEFGKDISDALKINVVVTQDVAVPATIINSSENADMAILKLDQPIQLKTPLKMAASADVLPTQTVYALGFPFITNVAEGAIQPLSPEQVNVTSGIVSKIVAINNVDYIQHECVLSEGNSGGPLVDGNGNVIGLNQQKVSDGTGGDYFYSIASDEITEILDTLGIIYPKADDTLTPTSGAVDDLDDGEPVVVDKTALETAIADAEKVDKDSYTEESYALLLDAVTAGKAVAGNDAATQEEVNAATTEIRDARSALIEKTGIDQTMLMIIIVGAVVVAVVIVLLVVLLRKKKGAGSAAAPQKQAAAPPQRPIPPQGMPQSPVPPVSPKAPIPTEGAGETSVLNEGAGETTLLSSQMMPRATITRVSNGESAILNKPQYTIGKERKKVDFCIANNNSVSRVHAVITYNDGAFYISDQNATNGTYVNGSKVNPGQEQRLNAGDKIRLADEEFDFRV